MLDVLITIDTETWPLAPDWRAQRLAGDIARDIDGVVASGRFGIGHQMDVMQRHQVKATFFVEAFFTLAAGPEPLRRVVGQIQDRGHEVQLHLHTEWLRWAESMLLPGRTGHNLKDFSLDEQSLLIQRGLEILRQCGAKQIDAFRAGNYGANLDTLRALARNGVRYDSSHNTCYLKTDCGLGEVGELTGPSMIEGVCEVPISFFQDWPGHHRHTQLCACSSGELEHAMMQAWRTGRQSFVIVSHSFELLRGRGVGLASARADPIVIRRFERLCQFLSDHRDKFRTCGIGEIEKGEAASNGSAQALRSGLHRTAGRMAEQLFRRVF